MCYRVLVVEDSHVQGLRMQLELQRYGLATELATTGPQGLSAAQANLPDLIVLDVDLPGLDGYSLCRALKADPSTAQIPVVMMTRLDQAQDALVGLEVGAVDYIPKDSFAEHNLIESIRHLGMI